MKPGDVIPSNSVIIPADVAKEIATHFRKVNAGPNSRNEKWADLLDPQPPSLRERMAEGLARIEGREVGPIDRRRAEHLAPVVANWLAAQPLAVYSAPPQFQRDHDVRILRGQS